MLTLIYIGAIFAVICSMCTYFFLKGRNKAKAEEIQEENIILKENKKDVDDIKAKNAASYTSDINAAHNKLRPYTRD